MSSMSITWGIFLNRRVQVCPVPVLQSAKYDVWLLAHALLPWWCLQRSWAQDLWVFQTHYPSVWCWRGNRRVDRVPYLFWCMQLDFFAVLEGVCLAVTRLKPWATLTKNGTPLTNMISAANVSSWKWSRMAHGICTYSVMTATGGLLTVLPLTPARSGPKNSVSVCLGWEIGLEFRKIPRLFWFQTFPPLEFWLEFHFSNRKTCSCQLGTRSCYYAILSLYWLFLFHELENVLPLFILPAKIISTRFK